MGSLSHVRVLDLSRVLAGPWASQLLGDLGAEVIKVEHVEKGDDTRSWGPPWLGDADADGERLSAYFLAANRNKQSVAVDLRDPRGQDIVRKLAGQCDVLIENFKVGGLRKYGLDAQSLRAEYPALVYCSITGFGQTGPYAHRPGYDFLVQGMGGLMSLTGRPDGEAGAGPLKAGVALTDILTGLYASVGILAALAHRDRTGEGQHIDAALLDVQVACLANQAMNYLASGDAPQRMGNGHPNIVPYQDFATADGYIIVTVGNDPQFTRLCETLERPQLATDSRFATNRARVTSRSDLIPLLAEAFAKHGSSEWLSRLEAAGVPCGPINDIASVFGDSQVVARGMRIAMGEAGGPPMPLVGNPLRLSATPVEYRRTPPRLGADTRDVLQRVLALDDGELASLAQSGVIRT